MIGTCDCGQEHDWIITHRIGDTRACPDCGRPQHYTGTEHGWAHDALFDVWHCADPRANTIVHDCGNAEQCWCGA